MANNPPFTAEEEHFRRQAERRGRDDAWDRLQQNARANRAENARQKAARLRQCPNCRVPLDIRTLRGVEIDQCSSCNGVWLDAGELEQLSRETRGFVARMLASLRRRPNK